MNLAKQLAAAQKSSRIVATLTTADKNLALGKIAAALIHNAEKIETANKKDLKKISTEKFDRLKFDTARIQDSAQEVLKVSKLKDPVGRILETAKPRAKFKLQKISVPLGVIAMIYESRPNVTIDAIALALKSGNAIVLRGSADALNSNRAIVKIIRESLRSTKIPLGTIQFLDSPDRKIVGQLLQAREFIDLVIPRGGRGLIDFVAKNSLIPTIETGASVVHIFVGCSADVAKAVKIIVNSKTRRTAICNALDTLLVHKKIEKKLLAKLIPELEKLKVKIHRGNSAKFDREWLSLDLNLKIVGSLDEALVHIAKYSLGHTEAIISRDQKAIDRFLREVDAACVYANLSTQFSDGGEFGLGAEIGISTQKMHARGPFALEALTSYKWVGVGTGQVRV
ncbi:glutamate-5-semialdehyde dehydrogenase [Candidatus Gracilibacteria bacterium]|nr:glutamate-5-semialdehyde dehydrogenase [Candidatus Gracilibacteria bacterium]MCF7856800.1 glutamate-5-semialdehyde dehydrogenase [Candidatus Gracilibacteria bacterium]MCF7897078.1 glutamate-5-semialdehyde dehydrogenase [Candidatus Gracilibacteria bacterium]